MLNDADTTDREAGALWSAAADAAVKGGARPPSGGWEAVDPEMRDYYQALAIGIRRARAQATRESR
jgi:hypothetical protein